MTKYEVVGYSDYDFQDQKTGARVAGRKYHFVGLDDCPRSGFTGREVVTASLSSDHVSALRKEGKLPDVGSAVYIVYNARGKVDGFIGA